MITTSCDYYILCVEVWVVFYIDEFYTEEYSIVWHMEIVFSEDTVYINEGCWYYVDLLIGVCWFLEIDYEDPIENFGYIKTVCFGIAGVIEMSIAKISFLLCPSMTSCKVVTVDYFDLIHLLSSLMIEG